MSFGGSQSSLLGQIEGFHSNLLKKDLTFKYTLSFTLYPVSGVGSSGYRSVEGDPTTDILATRSIAGVWKQGIEVDQQEFGRQLRQQELDTVIRQI